MLRRILQRFASPQVVGRFDAKFAELCYHYNDAGNLGGAIGGIGGTVVASSAFLKMRHERIKKDGPRLFAEDALLLSATNLVGCSVGLGFGSIFFPNPRLLLPIIAFFSVSAAAIETQNIFMRRKNAAKTTTNQQVQ
jgi:hypothetical protein